MKHKKFDMLLEIESIEPITEEQIRSYMLHALISYARSDESSGFPTLAITMRTTIAKEVQ